MSTRSRSQDDGARAELRHESCVGLRVSLKKSTKELGMKKAMLTILAAMVCLWAVSAQAEDWWEESAPDTSLDQRVVNESEKKLEPPESAIRVNWVDEYVEVMAGGTADPDKVINEAHAISVATKTARHLAYEKLAETISGINITADAVYDRELMVDSNLQTSVEALIRGAQVVEERHDKLSDGSIWAQVRLGIHLKGQDNSLMSSSKSWMQENLAEAGDNAQEQEQQDPAAEDTSTEAVEEEFTGLIVDAGGREVKPAMAPGIYSESGRQIYGYQDVDQDYLVQHGLVGYAESVQKAREMSRVGDNPLVVEAKQVRGKNSCDLAVSNQEAKKISSASLESPFLEECRVIFVVN